MILSIYLKRKLLYHRKTLFTYYLNHSNSDIFESIKDLTNKMYNLSNQIDTLYNKLKKRQCSKNDIQFIKTYLRLCEKLKYQDSSAFDDNIKYFQDQKDYEANMIQYQIDKLWYDKPKQV